MATKKTKSPSKSAADAKKASSKSSKATASKKASSKGGINPERGS